MFPNLLQHINRKQSILMGSSVCSRGCFFAANTHPTVSPCGGTGISTIIFQSGTSLSSACVTAPLLHPGSPYTVQKASEQSMHLISECLLWGPSLLIGDHRPVCTRTNLSMARLIVLHGKMFWWREKEKHIQALFFFCLFDRPCPVVEIGF